MIAATPAPTPYRGNLLRFDQAPADAAQVVAHARENREVTIRTRDHAIGAGGAVGCAPIDPQTGRVVASCRVVVAHDTAERA